MHRMDVLLMPASESAPIKFSVTVVAQLPEPAQPSSPTSCECPFNSRPRAESCDESESR